MSLEPSPDVLAAHLSGEAVLLNLNDKSYYRLNETAAIVWAALEKGESREQILSSLTAQYDVAAEEAERDMDRVIGDMKSRNLIVEKT
ncbi:MAG TPA: PqqD family protein [Gemmatimonadaceae bacterium]